MSEMEKEEFIQRMSALSIEEQDIAVRYFEDEVIFNELGRRFRESRAGVSLIKRFVDEGGLQ